MVKIVSLMTIVMGLTSCGTFFSVGGSTAGYNDTYSYGDNNNYGLMSYSEARQQALYLSDKMAYELGLNSAQYDAAYEINLDYLLNLSNYNDLYGSYWARRNSDLQYVLSSYQYDRYLSDSYFYRPVYWYDNSLNYYIYNRYDDPSYYYYQRPSNYSSYRGGHNRSDVSYYSKRTFGGRTDGTAIQRNTSSYGGSSNTRSNGNYQNNGAFGGRSTGYNQNNTNMNNTRSNGNTQNNGAFGGRSTGYNQNNTNTNTTRSNGNYQNNGAFGGRSTGYNQNNTNMNTTRSNDNSQGYAPSRSNGSTNNSSSFGGRSTGYTPSVSRPATTTTQPSYPSSPSRQQPSSTPSTTNRASGGHR
ncbi:MAG: hypothetical protein LKG25_08030 [Prevotella sp.]|nr:hypothetical protein [Prevotella sp.]